MNSKENTRNPIRQKILKMVLRIAILALIVTSLVGTVTMIQIKRLARNTLIKQTVTNLDETARQRTSFAESELKKFSGDIGHFASYIHSLYLHPEDYRPHPVPVPSADNAGIYALQRTLLSKDYKVSDFKDELYLLGNLEQVYRPVITASNETIMSIYAGTEKGFMVAFDAFSDGAVPEEGETECYYNYIDASWYKLAKESGKVCFTDVYEDSFGRGLMISCASPFYDASDKFAGVVCMDILISDLYKATVSMENESSITAFLIDRKGNLIVPDDAIKEAFDIKNLDENLRSKFYDRERGVTLSSNGVYYAYAPVESTGWEFCLCVPQEIVLESVHSMSRSILYAIILFVVILLMIITIVSMKIRAFSLTITHPLEALVNDVKVISQGNLDRRARVFENDEIGDVASGVNAMSLALKQYISDLTAATAEKERIGAELSVATHIQSSMLPIIFPPFPDREEIDIFASMNPAKEVGGDFYDFFMVDDRHIAIVMADVSGKGIPAALFMVIGKTLIKDHTSPGVDPADVFMTVNNLLCESNGEGLFITAFMGILDMVTGEFRYVNAGHEPPYIFHDGKYTMHKIPSAFVLAGMEDMKYKSGSIILEPGDKVFQYTDGVTEATDANKQLYGDERLDAILNKTGGIPANQLLKAVKEDIDAFVGEAPQFDDITMLCLEYKKRMSV
ncbi:HAMP domain-containing protein [Treponema ruminis]|uniref:Sigma-B regulation protein RsbU (Phosphoserine phosphatase) n=1 Tax=Treponema ruminis TaxID=744515 RepID=A0A7W8LLF6_9SPIR|nr:SpoIIE family protein phosphatase [Treponema ruminis]MBB5225437.1 sigma-B regulation protein RsbU (phosphoserine phosphatase) [Treponema ruminis]QSI01694.1 HAMP domain-containing protein [Treponema ruminis]